MRSATAAVFVFALVSVSQANGQIKRLDPLRRHVLLRADQLPSAEAHGAILVAPVPGRGVLVSVPDDADRPDLRRPAWTPEQKISPLLPRLRTTRADRLVLMVEFHPDTDSGDMRTIAGREGLEVIQHPDLPIRHLLARGNWSQITELSRWDEVAYLFPASAELMAGEPVEFCGGALTPLGEIGQYVETAGPGWDGPGQGSARLTYSVALSGSGFAPEQVKGAIEQALAEWGRYIRVDFSDGGRPSDHANLNVLFAAGDHGDSYPFDGPGRTLAHAFYPAPPNPEAIAGDVHLDADESWQFGAGHDVFSVALHELGHALGLGHSDDPGAVMYPHFRLVEDLSRADVLAIQQLYAAAAPPPPAVLELKVDLPAENEVTTEKPTLRAAGTVAGGSGEIAVTWWSSTGKQGAAAGDRIWVVPELPLDPGENLIRFTARESGGMTSSASLAVHYRQPSGPPSIEITWPVTQGAYETRDDTVLVSGKAAHGSGIVSVRWSTSGGWEGPAAGTTWWHADTVPLEAGLNQVTVTAKAGNGETASRTIQVSCVNPTGIRRSPSGGRGPVPSGARGR